jgi:predicted alpha-1,2-mannosidase
MRIRYLVLSILIWIPVLQLQAQKQSGLTGLVNPFIGSGGHGHTFPGASVPFGMVQLSPDTRLEGWDGCSAYHASDSIIYGFSHTHLSGTGCSDYGDILFMPVTGDGTLGNYGYSSDFDPATETASPGYYAVTLVRNKVYAELTATARCGFHRYTFSGTGKTGIVVDLKHRDKVLESGMKIVSDTEVEGYRISEAWAKRQIVYFVARFSRPFSAWSVEYGQERSSVKKEFTGDSLRGLFTFSSRGEKILVKVGISAVSTEGARKNLVAEIPGWDFDAIVQNAARAWNKELSKITVDGGTKDQLITFYTALYHTMLCPNLYMDVDGRYRGRDLSVHTADHFDYYTVFSLWDTYRAAHPLFTILEQKRTNDFINTFIRQYQEGGMIPVWELSGNETGCMIGYHSVAVIADAWMKGIRGYDQQKAFEAMKHSALEDHLGLMYFKTLGYIPADQEGESVSKTLEYAYDDWCISQMARGLGLPEDYALFAGRAQFYKNLYDPSTGFMRAKENSTWFSPFDPFEVNFNYTEANAWQYSFYVPQDLSGLMSMMGGRQAMSAKLDALFSADIFTTGRDQADISGLIGQYAHGNEPSHHMAYLYDYTAEPWKTQALVHRICRDFYRNDRDGLIGNEDCGQMSAWYVFSALGFYPVTPGSGLYAIGTPLFPVASIRLESGKTFVIKAEGVSEKNMYIQSATLNNAPYARCYLTHEDLMKGGELDLVMGPEPGKGWGSSEGDFPVSAISDPLIMPVPAVDHGEATFVDSTLVSLSSPVPGAVIRYTLDGTEPNSRSEIFKTPIPVSTTTTLKAYASGEGLPESRVIEARFVKIPMNRRITIAYPYAPQYSAGGDLALVNFIRGGENFRTGNWQGYEGVDLDATIDLGEVQHVTTVSAGFLQDQDSWIFYPAEIQVWVSDDGKEFRMIFVTVPEAIRDPEVRIRNFRAQFDPIDTRYVRLVAKNSGICPPWHPGAGKKAWLFCDEIVIE